MKISTVQALAFPFDPDRARVEGEQLELLMRAILKLFADGCLAYRERELVARSVGLSVRRLRALRGRP